MNARGEIMLKKIQVELLKPGDVLAKNVFNKRGIPFLQKGTIITEHYIKRLKDLNVRYVSIRDMDAEQNDERDLEEEIPLRKSITNDQTVHIVRLKLTKMVESNIINGRMNNHLFEMQFKRVYRTIMLDIMSHAKVMEQLGILWESDRYLFSHSLNVSAYAAMLGIASGYENVKMLELTIGALLFDIGMSTMPQSLLKCDRTLSDQERRLLEKHTTNGYEILQGIEDIPTIAKQCALLHHERYDGTGYPFHFKGDHILEQVQIVAICDVYDALISPRHHRIAYTEYDATEFLYAAGNHFFKAELIQMFLKNIQIYRENQLVLLSNGQVGAVSPIPTGNRHIVRSFKYYLMPMVSRFANPLRLT